MNIIGYSDISRSGDWGDYGFGLQETDNFSGSENNQISYVSTTIENDYSSSSEKQSYHFQIKTSTSKFPEKFKELSNKINEIFSDKIIGDLTCRKRILLFEKIYGTQFSLNTKLEERKYLSELDELYFQQSDKLSQIRDYLKSRIIETDSVECLIKVIIECEYQKNICSY